MENPDRDPRKPPKNAESGLDPKHGCFLGRAFSRSWTAFTSASVICWKSVSLEKYPRTRPFVCSFRPRSQEWYGVAKKNPAPSARATQACPANSLPLSAVIVWTRAASGSSISSSAAPTAAAVLRPTL